MKNILVTLELANKEQTVKILTEAELLAKAFQAKLWLIHIAAPDPEFLDYSVGPQYIRDEIADELRGEHRQIQRIANDLKTKGIDSDGLLIQGPTEKMILEEVDKLEIDLLIMGNKKQSFLHELFVGSITDGLMKEVNIPVYLVPLGK
jgi:nucleotide-binding universal stress UspA family protein